MPERELEGFEEVAKHRVVRDNCGIFHSHQTHENSFYTMYDWPFIEEYRVLTDKADPRIALIVRDYFDYITYCREHGINHLEAIFDFEKIRKPTELKYVTYCSDVSGLNVPFDPQLRQYFLFSQSNTSSPIKLFTVNLGCGVNIGPVKMTAPQEKIGNVLMEDIELELPLLYDYHKLSMREYELISEQVPAYAEETFNALMWESNHVV